MFQHVENDVCHVALCNCSQGLLCGPVSSYLLEDQRLRLVFSCEKHLRFARSSSNRVEQTTLQHTDRFIYLGGGGLIRVLPWRIG